MKATLILILTIFASMISFGQTNYYVSSSGNNGNSGSESSPWQTIQFGLDQLAGFDTLNVLPGTYSEKISIPIDNITVRNYTIPQPYIDATGITTQNPIIYIGNKSNITIEGLELRNNIQNDAQGILIDGAGSDITVKNCRIHDIHFSSDPDAIVSETTNAQGIIVLGTNPAVPITNLKLLQNQLYDCRLGYSEGIAVNGNVDGFDVSNNLVHDLTNIGIDVIGHEETCPLPANDQARNGFVRMNTVHHCLSPYATSGGIYVDGARNIVVEKNTSYYNGYGIEVGCEKIGATTDSILIRNNIFYLNDICGIALGGFDYPSGSGKVTHSVIRNNTTYYNDVSSSGIGELYLSYSENSFIENNIFYTNSACNLAYAELSQPSLNFNYNNMFCGVGSSAFSVDWNGTSYDSFSAFVTGSATNSNSVFGNPSFVSINYGGSSNLHLTSNSIAINAGNPLTVVSNDETDYFGELRVKQNIIDCGADEYGTDIAGLLEIGKPVICIYPNPATQNISILTDVPIEKYEIYNVNGERLIVGIGNDPIDIRELNSGLYFIHIYSGNSLSAEKFQKL